MIIIFLTSAPLAVYPSAHPTQTKKKQYQLEPYVEEEDVVPEPFAYQYGGVDAQGLEIQGNDGVVRGEYKVHLPDGRTQVCLLFFV